MDSLSKEIVMLVEKYKVAHLRMSDELFARNKERVHSIDRLAKQLGVTWNASFRVDDIDEELIEILRHSCCTSIVLGLESADNRVLKSMRKGITVEQIDNALELAHRAGVTVRGNFIFGDIEETIETAMNTLEYWDNHKEYNIALFFIMVFPGSYLYKYALENEIIKDPVQFLKDGCPIINVSKLSDDDLSYLSRRILDLSGDQELEPIDWILLSQGKNGVISINGKCRKCGNASVWQNLVLLVPSSWAICSACGTKHAVPFPEELRRRLVESICKLSNDYGRLGLWGVTKNSLLLFEENQIFMSEKYVFVDNASNKQLVRIHGKRVYPPEEAFTRLEIETVVFFYPKHYANFNGIVKRENPHIKRFLNVHDLM
jgi:hypothetical protein